MRLVLVAVLSLLPLVWLSVHAKAQQPPDIVVILTDDMRADDWPMLADTQRLVGGTWFPNFTYNTPLCCPFRASFQRGQMAHNTGVKRNFDGDRFRRLDNDTIATALDAVGYHTIYVGKYMNEYGRRAPGWDVWLSDNPPDNGAYWRGNTYITDALTQDAAGALQDAPGDRPLLLMLGHYAPHEPAKPEPKYADAEVGPVINGDDADRKRTLLSVDDSTERLAVAMGSRWDAACVVVLSDNGYLLGEHGYTGKSIWWDQASRVPMLIRCPGISTGTDARLASTVDVPATLLRAAGADVNHPLDGRPLQQDWQREAVLVESWADGKGRTPFRALKGRDWVYVEPRKKTPRYYLLADGESVDHIDSLTDADRQQLAGWLADLRDCRGVECG